MPRNPFVRVFAALVLLVAVAAGLLLYTPWGRQLWQSQTGIALIGGPFHLTDQNGQARSDADFRGQYLLVFFGYTNCPDFCPTTLTTLAAMETFARYSRRYGLPQALYTDLDSIYRTDREPTVPEQLRDERPVTQFGRAMKELAVTIVDQPASQAISRDMMNPKMMPKLPPMKEIRMASTTN